MEGIPSRPGPEEQISFSEMNRYVATLLADYTGIIVRVNKGIENETRLTLSGILDQTCPVAKVAALSGPVFVSQLPSETGAGESRLSLPTEALAKEGEPGSLRARTAPAVCLHQSQAVVYLFSLRTPAAGGVVSSFPQRSFLLQSIPKIYRGGTIRSQMPIGY